MSHAANSISSEREEPESKTSESSFVLNCIHSHNTEKDWVAANALAAGIHKAGAIPSEKDLRASWWAVGNQGDTGSCVGWASADSVLRWHFVHAKKLSQTEALSMRFIWMAAKESDEFSTFPSTFIESDGTSLKAALDIARKFGVVTDKVLPFGSAKLFAGEVNAFYAVAAKLKIASYFNLGLNPQTWRNWIAHNGPILTRLDVDATWDNATATKGILAKYQPKSARGGHAVSIVGYTADKFVVRNSWGNTWGDKGFAYATDAYATAAFSEAYGVSV